jgi:hypothetical protein
MHRTNPDIPSGAAASDEGFFPLSEAAWSRWASVRRLAVGEACALLFELDPDRLPALATLLHNHAAFSPALRPFAKAVSHATRQLGSRLPVVELRADALASLVEVTDFIRWAGQMGLAVPARFPGQAREDEAATATGSKWPWGQHETRLLRALEDAGKFWRTVEEGGNYDPDDPSSAPTNDQVVTFLARKGVSDKVARAMATILRADNLPVGPRPSGRDPE